MEFPVALRASSAANFTRWLSPPLKVVEGWPNLTYPNPTSSKAFKRWEMEGIFPKKRTDSEMVISSTSLIFFPLYFTASVSGLYLLPLQSLQRTYTLGRKFISMVCTPAPRQVSQRPPFTLNENRPALNPLILASGVLSNNLRISPKTSV